jgi:hypothetical protein
MIVSPLTPVDTGFTIPPKKDGTSHRTGLKFGVHTEPETLPMYTARIQEIAYKNNISLAYTDKPTQFQPMMYICKVSFGEMVATGLERSSKKDAKHEASKALWSLF